jgi:hypothetical protein
LILALEIVRTKYSESVTGEKEKAGRAAKVPNSLLELAPSTEIDSDSTAVNDRQVPGCARTPCIRALRIAKSSGRPA